MIMIRSEEFGLSNMGGEPTKRGGQRKGEAQQTDQTKSLVDLRLLLKVFDNAWDAQSMKSGKCL